MTTEFTLPELGENITAGDVLRVLVKPGDSITKDQPVLELETDKATIEVPSSVTGMVKDVKVKQGDKVKVGQAILLGRRERRGKRGRAGVGGRPEAAACRRAGRGRLEPAGDARDRRRSRGAVRRAPRGRGLPARTRNRRLEARSGCRKTRSSRRTIEGPRSAGGDGRQRRGEVVDISRGPRQRSRRGGRGGRAGAGRRSVGPPDGARARRRHPPGHGHGPRRPHHGGRREGVRARGARGRRRRQRRRRPGAIAAAARLLEMGRGRAEADEQHPPQDGGAPRRMRGTRSRT